MNDSLQLKRCKRSKCVIKIDWYRRKKNLMNDSSQLKVLIEILIETICIYDRN